jgi:capsular polysaccharide transport system ATP-binding protein
MIELAHVCKRYPTRAGMVDVLKDVNLTVGRGEKVGILGRNGAGKSTMIRILSGAEQPSSGTIHRHMRVSWPLAFGGAFQGSLTGLDNLRFICRIYGINPEDKIDYVQDFAELGRYFKEPVRTYSAGMQARLAFAISMVVEFDCFLIDEVISVGDARFHAKCQTELFEKRKDRALILVSHITEQITNHCDRAAVLHQGHLHCFDDVRHAYEFYEAAV